jgi:hypothetical protein
MKIIECCSVKLGCPDFTNTCPKCQADYNWAGQLLAPREQWGEETGETVNDILLIDAESFNSTSVSFVTLSSLLDLIGECIEGDDH